MMQQGDLVHIPQGTELWCETERGMRHRTAEKPVAGVYMNIYRVYANGTHWNVKRRDVYPMEQGC